MEEEFQNLINLTENIKEEEEENKNEEEEEEINKEELLIFENLLKKMKKNPKFLYKDQNLLNLGKE
jgi:hypothetical protein